MSRGKVNVITMLIYGVDNDFTESSSPHSIGLKNNLTIPNPGWDTNPLMINQKRYWGASALGCCKGMGLFETLDPTQWGIGEIAVLVIGSYALYSMVSTTRRGVRQAGPTLAAAAGRRRKAKAARLRAQAKKLEESGYSYRFF